jgi:hypothetical protein
MKTQISPLRSGTKNQLLNPQVDYSTLPPATSHVGHSGSTSEEADQVWQQVTAENPETMRIRVKGLEIDLKANWSLSRKSVNYCGSLSKEALESKFHLTAAKKETPYISIQFGNIIVVSNGKNSFTHICPSLVEIL